MTKRTSSQIADAIVDLVDRAGGPVNLARIEREVPGFAAENGSKSWEWVAGDGGDENVIWDGMTKQGLEALRRVLKVGRLAMQSCPRVVYAIEGRWPLDPTWVPISLAPASTANMKLRGWLIRGSQADMQAMAARAAAEGVSDFRVTGPPA
jgi:hypothetical protein